MHHALHILGYRIGIEILNTRISERAVLLTSYAVSLGALANVMQLHLCVLQDFRALDNRPP